MRKTIYRILTFVWLFWNLYTLSRYGIAGSYLSYTEPVGMPRWFLPWFFAFETLANLILIGGQIGLMFVFMWKGFIKRENAVKDVKKS